MQDKRLRERGESEMIDHVGLDEENTTKVGLEWKEREGGWDDGKNEVWDDGRMPFCTQLIYCSLIKPAKNTSTSPPINTPSITL